MGLDKKQLPQLIVLGVLVVACVGYISFRLAAPKPAVSTPAAKPSAEASATVEVNGETPEGESEALALLSPGEFPNLSVVPARRDPFSVQRMPDTEDKGTLQASVSTSAPKSRPNSLPNPFKADSTAKVPSLASLFGGNTRPSDVQVIEIGPMARPEDADPDFVLTGVVRGDENVAIIRAGQDGRYVVREGQLIDGRYRVKSVTDDGVVLVYKNRSIYLKLGGVTNAS